MVYSSGIMNSNNSNCSNSINSDSSNSGNSSVASAANSTRISPSSSGITTPTRISIKEANDHLQLLHSRVSELEEIIRSQSDQYAEQEETYRKQLKELKSVKEAQIDELTKTIVRLEERVKDLESSVKQKNEKLEENQTRLAQVDQLIDFLPSLEKLIVSLKQVTFTEENVISSIRNKESSLSNSPSVGFLSHQDNTNTDNDNNQNNSNDLDEESVDEPNDEKKIDDHNDSRSSLVDMAVQTDISGVVDGLIKPDLYIGKKSIETNTNDLIIASGISTIAGLCSSDPCYSKRLSIDETNNKEKPSPEERPVNGNGIDPVLNSDKQIRNTRSNRSRRMRKSSSAVNYHTSNNWEKDYYCGPSLTNPVYGPGRTIGYKVHSNGSSSSPHHLSNKIERSFSITSNFSEDEDFPSNGTRTSIISHNDYLN